jgi:hypothetical protein
MVTSYTVSHGSANCITNYDKMHSFVITPLPAGCITMQVTLATLTAEKCDQVSV